MRIPKHTVKPRFYVAVSTVKALSSWDDALQAFDSWIHVQKHNPKKGKNIKGIIMTSDKKRRWYP